MSIWIIEESPNPGIWNMLQSRGIYKSKARAEKAAKELTRWHLESLRREHAKHGWRYRATEYIPRPK